MDVLNTTGGGVDGAAILSAIFFGIGAIASFVLVILYARDREHSRAVVSGLTGALSAALVAFYVLTCAEPIRHEVTLRPGYVIDAAKYEIVEQRGKIYVIEEREAGE
ncbi:hypothetical protein [Paenibacillus dakarensis]|uniref:hypothetical protein n=1 Tax=Paenibacillus dakarensis TaxID=1527293 RepID=UPI0006D54209|nr:hypothetical protein [Paenibacillus dakarensis]